MLLKVNEESLELLKGVVREQIEILACLSEGDFSEEYTEADRDQEIAELVKAGKELENVVQEQ